MKRLIFVCLTLGLFCSVCNAQKSRSRKIYVDKEAVWVGEKEFLYSLNKSTDDVVVYDIRNSASGEDMERDEILCVNKIGDDMLVGTRRNGLIRLLEDNTLKRFMSAQWVYSTMYDNDTDELWVGTISRLYNISDNKVGYADMPGAMFSSDFLIRDICKDNNNVMWIANSGGIQDVYMSKYDAKSDAANDVSEFSKYDYLKKIDCGEDGILWVGSSQNGLLKFDNEKVVAYNMGNSNLPDDNINDLHVAEDGVIWMISGDKLVSFDGTSFVLHPLGNVDDLSNVTVDGNVVWVSSSTALYAYYPENGFAVKKVDFATAVSGIGMVYMGKSGNEFLYDISGMRVNMPAFGKIVVTSSKRKILIK